VGRPVLKQPIKGSKSSATTQSSTSTTRGEVAAASGFLKTSQLICKFSVTSRFIEIAITNCKTTRSEI